MLKQLYYFLCVCLIGITPVLAIETLEKDYVKQLNDAQFEDFIQKSDKPVIVDFWATWCTPCMQMKPIFAELANELKERYLFVSMNIDESQQIAKQYGVTSIPTFKVITNNTVIGTFMGYMDKKDLREHVENAIHKKLTHATLLSAIQTDDKELVAACLSQKDIDVNGLSQINVQNATMPMTPLIMAVSRVIFGTIFS